MKKRLPLFLLLGAVVGGSLWFGACQSVSETASAPSDRNVVIDERGIVIPGTDISAADYAAMNKILNKYDKKLYRLDTYEDGKRKKKQGTLTDVVTDRQLASQIATNVKRDGFTHYVVQVRGSGTNPASAANAPAYPAGPAPSPVHPTKTDKFGPEPAGTNPTKSKSDQLIEELKPILRKYQIRR